MIKATVMTPLTDYSFKIVKTGTRVELVINTKQAITATHFYLNLTDKAMTNYFVHYLSAKIASQFQERMSDTGFLTTLQNLINDVLINWQHFETAN